MNDLKDKTLGFLGWGSIGFPICYGLVKSGYKVVLPTYRKESAMKHGFCALVPDEKAKGEAVDWMLNNGGIEASSQKELLEKIDILVLSLPKSQNVEELIMGKDGVLEVCKEGTIIIDTTSADPMSTKMLAGLLEAKGMDIIDAPVSGGTSGAIAQTLSIMVGGKEEMFNKCRPILDTMGNHDKVMYMGPSGSGDMIKCANNFLSACCAAATTEAIVVCGKAGIDPRKAIEAIASSGGTSHAASFKFPNIVFSGNNWNFSLGLMNKDIGLFTSAAKALEVPALIGNITSQLWGIPMAENGIDAYCINVQKMYEKWSGVQICGLNKKSE